MQPAEAAPYRDNGHRHAPENAGHLIAAFASGRSDLEAAPGVGPLLSTARITAGYPMLLPDEELQNDKKQV